MFVVGFIVGVLGTVGFTIYLGANVPSEMSDPRHVSLVMLSLAAKHREAGPTVWIDPMYAAACHDPADSTMYDSTGNLPRA
jgi:hypothetical protein